jgi:hypothetical protein
MNDWKEIRHRTLDRIRKVGNSSSKFQRKSKDKSKSKKEITPNPKIYSFRFSLQYNNSFENHVQVS